MWIHTDLWCDEFNHRQLYADGALLWTADAGVYHVPSPNHYRNDFDLEGEAGDLMCAKWVEQEIIFQGLETVAAVIGEPISA